MIKHYQSRHLHTFLALCCAVMMCTHVQAQPASIPAQLSPQLPLVNLTINGRPTDVEMEDLRNPLMLVQTTRGDMVLELFPAEAPQTVANFVGLAEGKKAFTDPRSFSQAERPFYDGLPIHRVVNNFLIQGGSINGQSSGTPGFSFADEINAISLGLDKVQLLDEDGYPSPLLGLRDQNDFQQKVLRPLYEAMGINSQAALAVRIGDVESRLHAMSVKDYYELLGYRYSQRFQSRAPVRGMIAMANSGPDTNGSQFFILQADAPWLSGRHTVFGKIRAGMDVLDAIARVPVDANQRPLEAITILLIRRLTI